MSCNSNRAVFDINLTNLNLSNETIERIRPWMNGVNQNLMLAGKAPEIDKRLYENFFTRVFGKIGKYIDAEQKDPESFKPLKKPYKSNKYKKKSKKRQHKRRRYTASKKVSKKKTHYKKRKTVYKKRKMRR